MFAWHEGNPAVGIFLVVGEQEQQVEQTDERGNDVHNEACGAHQHLPHLGHGTLDGLHHVLLLQQVFKLVLVGVLAEKALHGFGNGLLVPRALLHVAQRHVLQVRAFLHHGRHGNV